MGNGKKAKGAVRRQYGVMPFVLEEVEGEGVLTAHAGLTAVVEAARGMGLPKKTGRAGSYSLSNWAIKSSSLATTCMLPMSTA